MNIEDCIQQYRQVYQGTPWYGSALLPSLQDIPVWYWDQKPEGSSHTITELAYHVLDWQRFVLEKLKNNITFSIELNTEADWRKNCVVSTEEAKIVLLQTFQDTFEAILEALEAKPDSWLYEHVAGIDYTNFYMINGAIQHDIYHLGQIRFQYQMLVNSEKK